MAARWKSRSPPGVASWKSSLSSRSSSAACATKSHRAGYSVLGSWLTACTRAPSVSRQVQRPTHDGIDQSYCSFDERTVARCGKLPRGTRRACCSAVGNWLTRDVEALRPTDEGRCRREPPDAAMAQNGPQPTGLVGARLAPDRCLASEAAAPPLDDQWAALTY